MSPNRSAHKNVKLAKGNGISVRHEKSEFYQGPIPSPEVLERIEQICPGATLKIITMAENQHNHRIDIENKVVASNIRSSDHGRVCGFVIGMTSIICGTLLGMFGHEFSGSVLGGGGITGLVSVFVYGAHSNRKERENKSKSMPPNK